MKTLLALVLLSLVSSCSDSSREGDNENLEIEREEEYKGSDIHEVRPIP